MFIWRFLVRVHQAIANAVLGRKLVQLDQTCRVESQRRRDTLNAKVEALEEKANQACRDAGLVTNGHAH